MSAIAKIENQTEIVQREKLAEYLAAFGLSAQLTKAEASQFIEVAQAFNLNPFKREIYCIPYGEGDKRKLSILTGYEVYLKRAERTGTLDGWKAWTEGTISPKTVTKQIKKRDGGTWNKEVTVWEGDLKAVVEIYRKDRGRPFTHEVLFSEYAQDNEMWGGKPHTMIKKVAIGQAFRLAFPDECAGMPYTAEELPDEMSQPRNVTPEQSTRPAIEVQATVVHDTPAAPEAASTYPADRTALLQDIVAIVGAKGTPGGWDETEKELIQIKELARESQEQKDAAPLRVAKLRAQIGQHFHGKPDWSEAMAAALSIGADEASLEALLKSVNEKANADLGQPAQPEMDIY